jgi:hypothetical protein
MDQHLTQIKITLTNIGINGPDEMSAKSVTMKPITPSVVMLSVIMLSVVTTQV